MTCPTVLSIIKQFCLSIFVSIIISFSLYGQDDPLFITKSLSIQTLSTDAKIDGVLDEAAWAKVSFINDFVMHKPIDVGPAKKKTEVKVFATNKAIYVSAKVYDDTDYVVNSLKRDLFGDDDSFCVLFDPTNQKSYGFGFGVNVLGAQTEVIETVGNGDETWDNKWYSATKQYDGYWIAEMEIPFNSIRFNSDQKTWGINFARIEPGNNEVYVWSPVPRQFNFDDISYYGNMNWGEAPKASKFNTSLIPYVNASFNQVANGDIDENIEVGGDAKVALSSSLNLDLTVNPDFSQVDVDQQVTNLSRFNIFFPERRQFFIEHDDIFSAYGQGANQPFYSRRVGLDPFGRTVPILYGARLTGNVTQKLRIGAFNIHSKTTDNFLGQNYSSLTFQQQIGARSNVKGLFLNRQAYDGSESVRGDYGRNLGGEVNLSTKDVKLRGQLGYIQSFKEGINDKNRHLYGRFDYNGQNFRTFLFIQNVGTNYFSDMGFNARINNFDPSTNSIVRIGYTQIGNMLNYYHYPKSSDKVNFHWSGIENFIYVNEGGDLNEWYTRFRHFIFFKNTSELRFRINHIHTDLIYPFALTGTPLPIGEYNNWEFNVQFSTDRRKRFWMTGFAVYGDFFNGNKLTYWADLNFRIQPWGNFALNFEQNHIDLPEGFEDLDLSLIAASAEINFSTNLFWTTFVQINTQADIFNLNSRLQWRYAPMSDLFMVYTDNYYNNDGISPVERTFVLKATYWLNL